MQDVPVSSATTNTAVGSVGSVGVCMGYTSTALLAVWCGVGRGVGEWVRVTRAGERERERTRNRTTHGEHHNRTVTGFPDLAHPLQSLILAFMLRLSTYTLHSLPSLQHRLATSATSSSSSFVRSSSSSRCAMSRSASSPSASCSRFPRAPLLALYYPIPALVRTSPPCAVASCHSRGRAKVPSAR